MIQNMFWQHLTQNKYPYDMKDWKGVKVDHWTLYYTWSIKNNNIIRMFKNRWYDIQENSYENKSIKGIKHVHFIKVI